VQRATHAVADLPLQIDPANRNSIEHRTSFTCSSVATGASDIFASDSAMRTTASSWRT
jgi:hypothetical protein